MKSISPKFAGTAEMMAGLINQHFGLELGQDCSRFKIMNWRKGKLLPAGINPFPPPNSQNQYEVGKCFKWVRDYIAAKIAQPTKLIADMESRAEASARREKAKANREERLDKKEAGNLIERAVVEIDAIGIVQRLHNACTLQDEQEVPTFCAQELKQLGVAPEIVALFSAKLVEKTRDITARRVAMFHDSTEEYLKGQK